MKWAMLYASVLSICRTSVTRISGKRSKSCPSLPKSRLWLPNSDRFQKVVPTNKQVNKAKYYIMHNKSVFHKGWTLAAKRTGLQQSSTSTHVWNEDTIEAGYSRLHTIAIFAAISIPVEQNSHCKKDLH